MKKETTNNIDTILDYENFKFFTAAVCPSPKCLTKFPKQIVLSDYNSECPECGTKVED